MESVVRVRGIIGTLVLDEWHGVLRQIFSLSRSKQIWEALAALIASAKRVIVLDALANNDDVELFRKYLTRPDIIIINNDYQPDVGKIFIVEQSHSDKYNVSLAALACGDYIVVFPHNKRNGDYSVESLAKRYQHRGYSVKYYHADTDPDEKRRDVSNPDAAFCEVRVVIHNKTIEAGVAIVDDRFQHLFAFLESIGSVEASKQAMHRFRLYHKDPLLGR